MHHRLCEHVCHDNGRLLWLNLLWMLTIVVMPVTTAMMGSMRPDSLTATGLMAVLYLVALVIATAIPGSGYLSLLLLSFLPLLHRLVTPRVSGWLASSGAGGLPDAQHSE